MVMQCCAFNFNIFFSKIVQTQSLPCKDFFYSFCFGFPFVLEPFSASLLLLQEEETVSVKKIIL